LVDVVDELGEVTGGDLLGLVEGREFGLGSEPFALGFCEPLGDQLGVSAGFEDRAVPFDLDVGGGDASAGCLGSLVDAGIGSSTVEEVSECVLDVLGIEQLREPAVNVCPCRTGTGVVVIWDPVAGWTGHVESDGRHLAEVTAPHLDLIEAHSRAALVGIVDRLAIALWGVDIEPHVPPGIDDARSLIWNSWVPASCCVSQAVNNRSRCPTVRSRRCARDSTRGVSTKKQNDTAENWTSSALSHSGWQTLGAPAVRSARDRGRSGRGDAVAAGARRVLSWRRRPADGRAARTVRAGRHFPEALTMSVVVDLLCPSSNLSETVTALAADNSTPRRWDR
jgi:hypothetical protein